MNNLKFDNGIYSRIKTCSSVKELADAVLQLTEDLMVWQKLLQESLHLHPDRFFWMGRTSRRLTLQNGRSAESALHFSSRCILKDLPLRI